MGRKVVGSLSTVSTEARDFTVLMLGFWLIERARERGADEPDVSLFLKWEQLAGYARVECKLPSFRGIERAKKLLSAGTRVTLSADPARHRTAARAHPAVRALSPRASGAAHGPVYQPDRASRSVAPRRQDPEARA
jgi:hypothetical protein